MFVLLFKLVSSEYVKFLQYQVARHICIRLNSALDSMKSSKRLTDTIKYVVIGGGVASNKYIQNGEEEIFIFILFCFLAISKVSSAYGLTTILVPPRLCTDNAEMIALTGLLKMEARLDSDLPVSHKNSRSTGIYQWPDIPDTIYAHARSDLGEDQTQWITEKPVHILSGPSIHGDKPLYIYCKEDFKK